MSHVPSVCEDSDLTCVISGEGGVFCVFSTLVGWGCCLLMSCASYYGHGNMYARSSRGDYLSMFMYRGPRFVPQPRLSHHDPNMTLRQICRMLKVMKQVKKRERAAVAAAAAAATARKQASMVSAPASPGSKCDKRCAVGCVRYKRSIKRVGWQYAPVDSTLHLVHLQHATPLKDTEVPSLTSPMNVFKHFFYFLTFSFVKNKITKLT